ncbi:MAG: hypothetical protein MPF33_05360 [Candidatus Aramenus sp.]|jgi:hypothetical protein|nr:hypothetical protein [Candidatus Aramenus sp.]
MSDEFEEERLIKTKKAYLVYTLSDPYVFAGISGHMTIYRVFDQKLGYFVPPADAQYPANKYKANVIVREEGDNVKVVDAVLEGPYLLPNFVSYKITGDKVMGSFEFTFKQREEGVLVGIRVEVDYKGWFTSRSDRLAEHLVRKHFLYQLSKVSAIEVVR